MPDLYIITGSNGAGKSTIGTIYLPEYVRNNYTVFDGDKLFGAKQKELWLSGIRANKEVKKIAFAYLLETFENLVASALRDNDHFVYEGHFTNDETWNTPIRFKESGYILNLYFLGLDNVHLSETRVTERVDSGGHFVPRLAIEENFYGNLEKLNKYYTLIDNLTIIDTSKTKHLILAIFSKGSLILSVPYANLPEWFIKYLPQLADKIKP